MYICVIHFANELRRQTHAGILKHCRNTANRCTHMRALPISGMESEVAGMISATNSMKTVNESSTVIPVNRFKTKNGLYEINM